MALKRRLLVLFLKIFFINVKSININVSLKVSYFKFLSGIYKWNLLYIS